MTKLWPGATGRELGSEPLTETPPPYRVVACLNVWNDRPALEQTLPSWYDHVDAVLAIDGAYAATGAPPRSTDGTREFLERLPKVTLLDVGGSTQLAKRNAYLAAGRPGDLLFIVDADEAVLGASHLRTTPVLDVGWCRITSALYERSYGQPRLIRWQPGLRYAGRHHWIYVGDALLATHQYGGPGFDHRISPITINNRRGLGHSVQRRVAKRSHGRAQLTVETPACATPASAASDRQLAARESLWILQAAFRDDGLAPSRLHTAINRTTPHASLFFKERPGPFGVAGQYSTTEDARLFAIALKAADIVHFHVSLMGHAVRTTAKQSVVIHHHGTMLRERAKAFAAEARLTRALVLVSNLDLLTYAPTAEFLPNAAPVARYRRLREQLGRPAFSDGGFRVAHSPSKPGLKGTAEFRAACARLAARGVPIVPVITTGVTHAEALAQKATCHAAFDSFALGMQCSGIEAAAMGLPVIAGDATVAQRSRDRFGAVPYTFANSAEELEHALARLIEDRAFYDAEAARVSAHVLQYHDESAVALRYLDLLDVAFGWRSNAVPVPRRVFLPRRRTA